MKVVVLWWTKWFWEWLVKFIFKQGFENISLCFTGRDIEAWNELSTKLWVEFEVCNKEAVKEADIVIFSVPISKTLEVMDEVAPFLKDDVILLDVTSIKNAPSKKMQEIAPENALVIPTHPMFGPFISTIAGQIIVLTPNEKTKEDERYRALKWFLEKAWSNVVEVSPEEHDKMMSIVQGLTHFNMFVLAWTIEKTNTDLAKTFQFVSPIYKILVSSVWRYIHQNPWLYADIQMNNEENLNVYSAYLDTVSEYLKSIENKDYESFVNSVAHSKKFFWSHAMDGQKYTDKIIHLIWKQSKIATENIGNVVRLENIYDSKVIEDKLLVFNNWIFETEKNGSLHIDEWEIIK